MLKISHFYCSFLTVQQVFKISHSRKIRIVLLTLLFVNTVYCIILYIVYCIVYIVQYRLKLKVRLTRRCQPTLYTHTVYTVVEPAACTNLYCITFQKSSPRAVLYNNHYTTSTSLKIDFNRGGWGPRTSFTEFAVITLVASHATNSPPPPVFPLFVKKALLSLCLSLT